MAPVVFSGALKPKKKAELQDIANALSIPATGTKDDLESRIREHLDANEATLADHASFTGLFGRRKRSTANPGGGDALHDSPSEDEGSPAPGARNAPKSRGSVVVRNKEGSVVPAHPSPALLPPLPPSPVRSIITEAIAAAPGASAAVVNRLKTSELVKGSEVYLQNVRSFVSNSTNIATLTIAAEAFLIFITIVPFVYMQVPLTPPYNTHHPGAISKNILSVPIPVWSTFAKSAFWWSYFTWALPTLLVPQIFGALISFSEPRRTVDPLSAGIVRVATAVAGQWTIPKGVIHGKWRVLSASVAVAFAFAEAVERKSAALRKVKRF